VDHLQDVLQHPLARLGLGVRLLLARALLPVVELGRQAQQPILQIVALRRRTAHPPPVRRPAVPVRSPRLVLSLALLRAARLLSPLGLPSPASTLSQRLRDHLG